MYTSGIYIQTSRGAYIVPQEKEAQLIAWLEANAKKPSEPQNPSESQKPSNTHLLFE